MKKFLKKSKYIVAIILVFAGVISCEKDFTDIGSSIISNTAFTTSSLLVDVELENSPVTKVSSGNISLEPGNYLLGVHASTEYEKIEASLISQLSISSSLQVVDDENKYVSDTTVVTTIDTVFIRLPYQVKLNDDASAYELDSIIGDPSKAFNLNVFQTSTYLSILDPSDPAKLNSFSSDDVFEKETPITELNDLLNFQFIPKATDTSIIVKRWLSDLTVSRIDTVSYTNSTSSTVPVPFAAIPLKEDVIKELFLDKYDASEFDSQDAFNNYFRGLILEATGDKGSLISFNFNGVVKPSLEIYYTNTVLTGGVIIDTIQKNDSFLLSGIRTSTYKMEDKIYPENNEVKIQGAAGSEATIKLFGEEKIAELRDRNLLINDASLTLYINQSKDTTALPYQLFLYKSDEGTNPIYSQVKDLFTEGPAIFGGLLERDSNGKKEKYTFRITDYVSDILSGKTDYSPLLRLKAINLTDLQTVSDTVFTNYNWNPKAVTIFNHYMENDSKKAVLKISYSERNN